MGCGSLARPHSGARFGKVDAKKDTRLAIIVRDKYEAWKRDKPSYPIFWEFIEDERNRILKEYDYGFLAGSIEVTTGNELFVVDANLFKPLADGRFAGEDCRDILRDAIAWWDLQLAEINNMYKRCDC